jgi:uncharacterized peroxidase-related enzyme
MTWIKEIDYEESTGQLRDEYDNIIKRRGKLSNIMKVHSLNPKAMRYHMDFYVSILFSNHKITREERELVATAVSVLNKCDYCINHHAEALNFYWKDKKKIKKFINDLNSIEFSNRQKLMIDYAILVTENSSQVSEEIIEELRRVGLEDQDILNLNLIVSYFNFVNRVANGLGVKFSEEEVKGYNY